MTMMDSLESIASCGQQLGLYKLNKKRKFTLPLFSHISDKISSMKIILISNVSVFNFQQTGVTETKMRCPMLDK